MSHSYPHAVHPHANFWGLQTKGGTTTGIK